MTLILSGLWAFAGLREFYVVAILGRFEEYPFGGEGPTPYYYQTKELYLAVVLFWGLAFLVIILVTAWAMAKRKPKGIVLLFVLTILLILGQFMHTGAGV